VNTCVFLGQLFASPIYTILNCDLFESMDVSNIDCGLDIYIVLYFNGGIKKVIETCQLPYYNISSIFRIL
jgi:hypothetical protein